MCTSLQNYIGAVLKYDVKITGLNRRTFSKRLSNLSKSGPLL